MAYWCTSRPNFFTSIAPGSLIEIEAYSAVASAINLHLCEPLTPYRGRSHQCIEIITIVTKTVDH